MFFEESTIQVKMLKGLILLLLVAFSPSAAFGRTRLNAPTNRDDRAVGNRVVGQETASLLEFHSGFWTSLHMFLCQEAIIRNQMVEEKKKLARQNRQVTFLEYPGQDKLSADQRKVWEDALDFYFARMTRGAGPNHEALEMSSRLSGLKDSQTASGAGVGADLAQVLNQAAPIYREVWWQENDRANKKWAVPVSSLFQRIGTDVASKLSGYFQSHWPQRGIRIETVPYIGSTGFWVSPRAQFVMVATSDSKNQRIYAVEVALIGAAGLLDSQLQTRLTESFKAARKPVPPGLPEALLYYTTGEVLRTTLAAKNLLADYTPYAIHNGLYTRNPGWGAHLDLLKRCWQPYLEGKTDFDHAMANLTRGT